MRLAQKVATVLAMTGLVKSEQTRKALTEQADAALSFMALEGFGASANAVLDSAAAEALHVLKRDGWKDSAIADHVRRELARANVEPTVKGQAVA